MKRELFYRVSLSLALSKTSTAVSREMFEILPLSPVSLSPALNPHVSIGGVRCNEKKIGKKKKRKKDFNFSRETDERN